MSTHCTNKESLVFINGQRSVVDKKSVVIVDSLAGRFTPKDPCRLVHLAKLTSMDARLSTRDNFRVRLAC